MINDKKGLGFLDFLNPNVPPVQKQRNHPLSHSSQFGCDLNSSEDTCVFVRGAHSEDHLRSIDKYLLLLILKPLLGCYRPLWRLFHLSGLRFVLQTSVTAMSSSSLRLCVIASWFTSILATSYTTFVCPDDFVTPSFQQKLFFISFAPRFVDPVS